MSGLLLPGIAVFLLLIVFLLALVCYSLRDFSRSRLDEICVERGNELRFSLILKKHEQAILATELAYLAISIAFLVFAVDWLALLQTQPETGLQWITLITKWLVFIVVLYFLAVILPWSLSHVAGEKFLYHSWPFIHVLLITMHPFLTASRHIDKIFHRLSGREEPSFGDSAIINEEIRTVLDEGHSEGLLESGARTMIHRVIELREEDVAAIMTPRTDMLCINVDSSLEEARLKLLEAGHSRVPVIGESTDDLVGILYAKDFLKYLHNSNHDANLREIVREPFYVPETTHIDKLLETMKLKQVHVAIVLDEYGGVAGLVTMEDILEEIVGEIDDEYDDPEDEPIQQIEPGLMDVDARVHIDDLNDQFEFDLPEHSDYDTIGGFVFSHLGRIPELNESFTWSQLRFTVLEADKRKIVKLRIEIDKSLAEAKTEEA